MNHLGINIQNFWLYIIIFVVPLIILIIGSGFILKWYDKKFSTIDGVSIRNRTGRKINKTLIESSVEETHINHIKEIINQTILQRSLVSRIKIEVQGFGEMIKSKHTFYEDDFSIIQNRITELDHQMSYLKQVKQNNHESLNDFTFQTLEEDSKILSNIRTYVLEIIQAAQSLDYKKYVELIDRLELDYQSLITIYQTLTIHIREQLG